MEEKISELKSYIKNLDYDERLEFLRLLNSVANNLDEDITEEWWNS